MKIAAFQAPLLPAGSMDALPLIRDRIRWCEVHGVGVLCCPEAILGGLADYASDPFAFALNVTNDELSEVLAPLACTSVATIVGFTERSDDGVLFNSAAIFDHGEVVGVYRKRHPAIRKSIYSAGTETPVFTVRGMTFGILICNDSNFPDDARAMAEEGARVLFIPSNNGLPHGRPSVVDAARKVDIKLATTNRVHVVRTDVVGVAGALYSHGTCRITLADGREICSSGETPDDLVVAEIAANDV